MSNRQKTEQEFSKIYVKLKNSKNALEGAVWTDPYQTGPEQNYR